MGTLTLFIEVRVASMTFDFKIRISSRIEDKARSVIGLFGLRNRKVIPC
jgi:hypothetical protein